MSLPPLSPTLSPEVEQAIVGALESLGLPVAWVSALTPSLEVGWASSSLARLVGVPTLGSCAEVTQSLGSCLGEQERSSNCATDLGRIESRGFSERRLTTASGVEVPVGLVCCPLATGEPGGVVLLEDLRPRQAAEDALLRAERRFAHLVDSVAECVWIVRSDYIVYANRAAMTLLGLPREQLVERRFSDFCHPDDAPAMIARFRRISGDDRMSALELRLRAGDGRTVVFELSSVAVEFEGDAAVLSFGRDVTERKCAELNLLQADRLAALGLLAGGMAHALNNPLTYVLLNLDHVGRSLPTAAAHASSFSELAARLSQAREGAERMAAVVKRMRAFSRTDESEQRSVDLRAVLETVSELVGNEVSHRGRLIMRLEQVPPVSANESRVEQICMALLLFAARILPEGGARPREVRVDLSVDEHRFAIVEVTCEGAQLDAVEVEQLFDPFAPNDQARIAGFGLSVCAGLVTQMGGRIEAERLPGTGVVLRVALPCLVLTTLEVLEAPDRHSSEPPPANGRRARVLVIDDELGVGRALRLMLEDEHEVTCYTNPRDALRALMTDSGFDIIFCDVVMPELTGMDIFQVLRFNRPGYENRLVFMTGGVFTAAARRFLAQVQNPRLEKPFNLKSLQRLVRRAGERH